jgi:hypothetical protein
VVLKPRERSHDGDAELAIRDAIEDLRAYAREYSQGRVDRALQVIDEVPGWLVRVYRDIPPEASEATFPAIPVDAGDEAVVDALVARREQNRTKQPLWNIAMERDRSIALYKILERIVMADTLGKVRAIAVERHSYTPPELIEAPPTKA